MVDREIVVLVVGNEIEHKSRVSYELAQGALEPHGINNAYGVRIFKANNSPWALVVDTIPILACEQRDGDLLMVARQWVSVNSFRRLLLGKSAVVICVAMCSVSQENTKIRIDDDLKLSDLSWLHVFGSVFKDFKESILILVNTEGNPIDEQTKSQIKRVFQAHGFKGIDIIYSNFTEKGASLKKLVEDRLSFDRKRERQMLLKPFVLREVWKEKFGVWSPERVILFGRTGSGKSTLAQMLTLGKLDPHSKDFASSSSIRGKTKRIQSGEGRGWYIVDTPGFGEPPKHEGGTVSTKEAEERIKWYVSMIGGTYTHFIYVLLKDRIDELDKKLWDFFVLLFGEDIKSFFSIVVSNADKEWMDRNVDKLKKSFVGCESFLCAEFPPVDEEDDELEMESKDTRLESLRDLEDELAKLERHEAYCDLGNTSKSTVRINKHSWDLALGAAENSLGSTLALDLTGRYVFNVGMPVLRLVKSLSKGDDQIVLLP